MNRARPADPIFYRWHWWMLVRCSGPGCDNRLAAPISAWAQWSRAPRDYSINSLMDRLICSECCRRRPFVDVVPEEDAQRRQRDWRWESSLLAARRQEKAKMDELQERFRAGVEEEAWLCSSMAKFMATQPEQVERVLAEVRGNWDQVADAFAIAGLTDQDRKPPTGKVARETWERVNAARIRPQIPGMSRRR